MGVKYNMKIRTVMLAVCGLAVASSPAMAHPQLILAGNAGGLVAGFCHPWLGLDHLLAMIAVGLLSVRLGRRAIWILPASFLGLMTLGGAIGMAGIGFHRVEFGVALSVVVLGLALASGRRSPLFASAVIVGAAGLLHGHAHGTEIPAMVAPVLYAAGFISATAVLHLTGIVAGTWLVDNNRRAVAIRLAGAAISCAGLLLLSGTL